MAASMVDHAETAGMLLAEHRDKAKFWPFAEPEQIFPTLARTFNENAGPRAFVHAFGMICGHGPSAIPFDDPKRSCILGETRPLKDEIENLTNRYNTLRDEAENTRRELQIIKQSASWKITRPLRSLKKNIFGSR